MSLGSRHLMAIFVAGALVGCAGGTVRQLEQLKSLSAAGDETAVAAQAVSCTSGQGCAQAHRIKADACLALARDAALDAREPFAACARKSYGDALAALSGNADPRVDPARLARDRLEAIRLERDAAEPSRALTLNAILAAEAEELTARGEEGTAAFYRANALAFATAFDVVSKPCATLADAHALAARADAQSPALGPAAPQLRRDIEHMQTARGCRA